MHMRMYTQRGINDLTIYYMRIEIVTASTHLEWPCVDRFTPDPLETVDSDTKVSAIYDQWVSHT
jgi:hypothetical protein